MVGIAILTGVHWYSPRWNENWLALLADILSAAMGISIALTIAVEVVGRMVLLIPEAIKNIRDKEKRAQKVRRQEAYERFGVEIDGKLVLPISPELEAFLNCEEPSQDT